MSKMSDLFDAVHVADEPAIDQEEEATAQQLTPDKSKGKVAWAAVGVVLLGCGAGAAAYWGLMSPREALSSSVTNKATQKHDLVQPRSGSSSQEFIEDVARCCPHVPELCDTDTMRLITLPPGFCISEYARVPGARMIEVVQDAELGQVTFVGTVSGSVHALVDSNVNGTVTDVVEIQNGRVSPQGVAYSYSEGALYVAEREGIVRLDDVMQAVSDGRQPQRTVLNSGWNRSPHHGQRVARFAPDGSLMVTIGVPCNTCDPDTLPCPKEHCHFGHMLRVEVEGKDELTEEDLEVYARGIRNSEGFDFHPTTGDVWFTDNGRDLWGQNRPADELNHASREGLHFGFPYCYGYSDADLEFNPAGDCSVFEAAAVELGPHVAALGMRFYKPGAHGSFPPPYDSGLFIAEHGSWNRDPYLGFRVTFVPVLENKFGWAASEDFEIFVDGFLRDEHEGDRNGRPVDVAFLDDGSLIFSDDYVGILYNVYHSLTRNATGGM